MIRWIATCGAALALFGMTQADAKPPRALFADDRPLHLVLRGPIAGLANSKAPLAATLTIVGDTPETIPVQISARGITRRRHDICPFSPIRVIFAAELAPDSLFARQKTLKLVTHCQPKPGFEQYELLELAAYRIYALMTPLSFRTRLATIDYIGSDGHPIATRPGFFLEDVKDVARRNELPLFKTTAHVPSGQISGNDAARFAMYSYLISNLDWAMNDGPPGTNCCHNARLLGTPGTSGIMAGGLVPVPYDFDFSGLVDAPYATPPQGIEITGVRQRLYRGYCRTNDAAKQLAAEMTGQRAAIMAVVDGVPGLEDRPRQKADAYLAEFFDRIASPAGLDKVLATCLR